MTDGEVQEERARRNFFLGLFPRAQHPTARVWRIRKTIFHYTATRDFRIMIQNSYSKGIFQVQKSNR